MLGLLRTCGDRLDVGSPRDSASDVVAKLTNEDCLVLSSEKKGNKSYISFAKLTNKVANVLHVLNIRSTWADRVTV